MKEEKSKYFKMGEALDDVNYAYGTKDKAVASLKLIGKGLFNVGRFAVAEALPSAIGHVAQTIDKNPRSSDEQREKASELKKKADEYRENLK
ncbi:hypothetical protein LH442_15330 [Laribacter hongkongensis]|uniref:hypothetical protein n=1 Tax=Laribacter hongkongensis TaxID=168471 RepID=UPI001EFDA481|nr:hypothetical protein [Laribacter hongkongensis]MCG9057309.1 hypothetical protein [Laribacter hongkongensis]